MSVRISHANIRVADPASSVRFYRALGLELTGCLQLADGYYLLYMTAPDEPAVSLELAVNENADDNYSRDPGSGHLALAVGDLDSLVSKLSDSQIDPESAPFHPADRPDVRVCFVVDPDGTRVELIEGNFPTPSDPFPAEWSD